MRQELDLREIIERIFQLLPTMPEHHRPDSELYLTLEKILQAYFLQYKGDILDVAPFDGMVWPFEKLGYGTFTSYDFFGSLHEMPLYSFYWINRDIYKTALEIGANLGVDSIILSRFGYEVHSFEPDPLLYEKLVRNISLNQCKNIYTYQKAVSDRPGTVDFVRVLGQTAANHILGSRDFYGEAEYLKVEAITFADIGIQPDLMKINVEGHEKIIVPSISYPVWEKMDAFIEVHSEENTKSIFNYFLGTDINIFSQKTGWQKVKTLEDMPFLQRAGYIFVSKKQEMPWLCGRKIDKRGSTN